MKKKLILVACLAVGAAALFTGISFARSNSTITLTVWTRTYPLDQQSPYYSAAKKFEKLHPGVKVNFTGFDGTILHQKLLLGKAGGPSPDIEQTDTIWLGEFAQNGIATNLDSNFASWPGKKDYPANFLTSSKWKGHYYGAWLNTDVRILLWNKDVFRKAGLNPDVGPKTWAQVVAMGKQIQQNVPGVNGVVINAAASEDTADYWYPFLWMSGGDILNKSWTKAAFNSKAGIRALQFYVDLVNKYKVTPPDVITQDSTATEQALLSGAYGIELSQSGSGYGDLPKKVSIPTFKHMIGNGVLPTCGGCQPATGSGGWLLTINSKSKYKALDWELIKLIVDGKNNVPFNQAQATVPVRSSIIAKYRNGMPGYPYFDVVAATYPHTHFRPWVPQYPKFVPYIYTAVEKAVAGQLTAKQALDQAAAQTNKVLAAK
jgi:ABC-type glycerol-3-phosphate transport system substrate-binding protein